MTRRTGRPFRWLKMVGLKLIGRLRWEDGEVCSWPEVWSFRPFVRTYPLPPEAE